MTDSTARPPYDRLFIYYLSGRPDREPIECEAYIGTWQEEDSAFVFFHRKSDGIVQRVVSNQPDLKWIDSFEMSYDEWQGETLGRRDLGGFVIVPGWEADTIGERTQPNHILMDPGVVFGNGAHPTTQDCMEAIDLALQREPLSSAIDLGTGTGILALAAWKLGFRPIVAVDFNRLAIRTAAANFRLNGAQDDILPLHARAENVMELEVDLLIANIHFSVMKDLIESPGFVSKRQFILSGLLRSEIRQIESMLSRLPVTVLKRWQRDGVWHTLWGFSHTMRPTT
ncbi:MAG: 50S ribosomal protein L11 methyltransferase [Thermodesulfobacteriota bacterium]